MSIEHVGVVGCGLMGSGIAQVSAQGGYKVTVHEVNEQLLAKGLARVHGSLAKLVEKGKLSAADADATRQRLTGTLDLAELKSCDLVIEAIVEDLAAKKKLFADLGKLVQPQGIFASNTSSLPITEMARASGRPQRFVGLHFFNPVPLMKLVEVVRTEATDAKVLREAQEFAARVGKIAVTAKDTPGFIVNRLLVPYMLEAIRMLERGDATKEDIDKAMVHGCGYPMGPITLTDYVGLDTSLFITEGWHQRFPDDPAFVPPKLLRELVQKGQLGRKTGRGFYEWEGDKRK
jgi:3-hydroxyacyl-CoA dehydrogenase